MIDYGHTSHLDEHGAPKIVKRHYRVNERHHGYRADVFLKEMIPRLSRNKIQRYIKLITTRNDKVIKPHTKVFKDDVLLMTMEARKEPPCPRIFSIIYEDKDLFVINKPSGLPVHSSAKYYFNTLIRVLFEAYPDERMHLCHRLDKETSGCIVIARNKKVAGLLKPTFKDRLPKKKYIAMVYGEPPWQDETILDFPVALAPKGHGLSNRMVVTQDGLPAKTAVTILESSAHGTLVECKLLTGRQHQIRLHCQHAGFPIVGDKLYTHGDDAFVSFCKTGWTNDLHQLFRLRRQALHASEISFVHPITQKTIHAKAPLPPEIRHFFETGKDTDDFLF